MFSTFIFYVVFFCDVENLFILQLLLILHGMFLNLVKENEIVFCIRSFVCHRRHY